MAHTLPAPEWRHASSKPLLPAVLLIALVLHALLLLIPLRSPDRLPPPKTLEVEFDYPAPPVPMPEAPVQPLPESVRPDQVLPPPAEIRPLPAAPMPKIDEAITPTIITPAVITTALMLGQARNRDIDQAPPVIRIPGVPYLPDLPANLARPVLPLEANAFDGYVITGEAKTIDQWIEPGGTINAVVKLPNGEIICSRAEPWDEMNPLFEPVAMSRRCGSGGNRSPADRSPFSQRE